VCVARYIVIATLDRLKMEERRHTRKDRPHKNLITLALSHIRYNVIIEPYLVPFIHSFVRLFRVFVKCAEIVVAFNYEWAEQASKQASKPTSCCCFGINNLGKSNHHRIEVIPILQPS